MIALTGATGFVGRRVVRRLVAAGVPFRALVRAGASLPVGARGEVVRGALEEPAALEALTRGAPVVVHLASRNTDPDDAGFDAVNVEGTAALLAAARRAGARQVLYLSSAGVYGHTGELTDADEGTAVVAPDTALSRSKAAAERLLVDGHRDGGPAAIILRPRFVLGPGDRFVLPGIARTVRRARWLPLSGRARLSLVHVDDLAEVIVRLCERPAPPTPTVLHVTDGRPINVRALFGAVASAIGAPPPRFLPLPFPLVYGAMRAVERLRGGGGDRGGRSPTSTRLALFGRDQWLSNRRLCATLSDLEFRPQAETLAAPQQGS